jgi:hypothetical protein
MRSAGWIAGSVALAGVAVLVVLRERDEGGAYAVGAALGALLIALLVAALLRLAYVRLVAKRGSVLSPWLLAIATVVALGAIAIRAGQDEREVADEVDTALSQTRDCRAERGGPFRPLPAGLEYSRLRPAQERALEETIPPELRSVLEARLVTDRGTQTAVVIAAAAGDEREDAQRGFEDRLTENGATLSDVSYGGNDAVWARVPGGVVAGGTTECDFVMIQAVERGTLDLLGEALIGRE